MNPAWAGKKKPARSAPAGEAHFSAPAYSEVLPVFMIDHSGFAVPDDEIFAIEGMDPAEPIFPLYSASRSGKATGLAMIPGKYLDLANAGPFLDGVASEITVLRGGGNLNVYHGKYPFGSDHSRATGIETRFAAAVRQMKKTGYVTHFLTDRQTLVGADPDEWSVQSGNVSNDTFAGLSLSPSFRGITRWASGEKRKVITNNSTRSYGLTLSFFGGHEYSFSEQVSFLDVGANPFGSKNLYDRYLKSANLEDVSAATLRNSEYLKVHLFLNSISRRWAKLRAVRVKDLKLTDAAPDSSTTGENPPGISAVTAQALTELRATLPQELQWRERVSAEVADTLLVDEAADQALVRRVCTDLGTVLGIPAGIFPRCHLAASWVPAAYAYPGGDIFVTAGLLARLKNLEALYSVLGYELGHVVGRHASRRMPYWDNLSVPSAVLGMVGRSFALPPIQRLGSGLSFTDWLPDSWGGEQRSLKVREFGERLLLRSLVSALIMHSEEAQSEARIIGDDAVTLAAVRLQAADHEAFRGLHEKYAELADENSARLLREVRPFRDIWEDYARKTAESPAGRDVLRAAGGRL